MSIHDYENLQALMTRRQELEKEQEKEQDRLRDHFKKIKEYSPMFSWLKVRTTWENTRPNANPIRVTCDGGYGIRSALMMAANDLAWPRLDPHSRALKVEIFFDPCNAAKNLHNDTTGATLIATIVPPQGFGK